MGPSAYNVSVGNPQVVSCTTPLLSEKRYNEKRYNEQPAAYDAIMPSPPLDLEAALIPDNITSSDEELILALLSCGFTVPLAYAFHVMTEGKYSTVLAVGAAVAAFSLGCYQGYTDPSSVNIETIGND